MPPQGLLLIAAYLPDSWDVRFIDENMARATPEDFIWADAILVSGMHVQAPQIYDIVQRAHEAGKVVALGGPSVSAAPEQYPDIDYLHVGEIGDATDALIARLDRDLTWPKKQIRYVTKDRVAMSDFPIPAYNAIPLGRYLIRSLQFSSGCPYQCEFCDIPGLYGRVPRLKSAEQLITELEAMLEQPARPTTVYFVDDNFIGNKKAAREMLVQLVAWQKRRGYPFIFACEATLNIAKQPDILALMREAAFVNVFVGIETPDLAALKQMRKDQNATLPMLEAIKTLNSYGLEVTSGIIVGLDSDGDASAQHLLDFIDESKIPILTINVLQALPKTPLWDRLMRDGRLLDNPQLESNIQFLRPYENVIGDWRHCIAHAYAPEQLFARFRHQVDATYVNRLQPAPWGKLTLPNLRQAAVLAFRLLVRAGIKSDYRREFWRAAWRGLRRGQIDAVLGMGFASHHLIQFTREALRGEQNASFYSVHDRREQTAKAHSPRGERLAARGLSDAQV